MNMIFASASSTSTRTSRIRHPQVEPPVRFERVKKAPGSKKLVLGEWVEVTEEDEDATD